MGKIRSIGGFNVMSGRPSRQDKVYVRTSKKAGVTHTVAMTNPRTTISANQKHSANAFSLVIPAISQWIRENKAANSAEYQIVKKMFDEQNRYSMLRGYMYSKGMYVVSEDKQSVVVDINARTDFKSAFGIRNAEDE